MKKVDARGLALVHYAADAWEHVCPVVRIVGPAQEAGWRLIRGNEWESGTIHVYPERVSEADIIIIQRDFPRYVEEYENVLGQARGQGKTVLYELDDLLTELPDLHPDKHHYMSVRASVLAAVAEVDAVTCPTSALADYIRSFNPNVWVLPNYLNDRLWTLKPLPAFAESPQNRPLVIGYLGAHSHNPDLEMIAPVLGHILERYGEDVVLRLWGIAPPSKLVGMTNMEWLDIGMVDYAEFAAYFSKQECDIFIAPLLDNLFNRCKSSLKHLEYSALGAPGIYSDAAYANVVKHGENGFLATTLEDWEKYLTMLIENPSLRYQMGSAAQASLRKNWLLSDHLSEWAEAYKQLYSSSLNVQKPEPELRAIKKLYDWNRDDQEQIRSLSVKLMEEGEVIRGLHSELTEKENIISEKAKTILEMQDRTRALSGQLSITSQTLSAITNSTGWKLLEAVYWVRLKLAPRGSRRERLLRLGVNSLRFLISVGPRSLASKIVSTIRQEGVETVLSPEPVQVQPNFTFVDGERCPTPSISVIIEKSVMLPPVDEMAMRQWVKGQTLPSVELVLWDRTSGLARTFEAPERIWEAPTVEALCRGLDGRYMCMASQDLLQQNNTYLEVNLIALESENLLFTLNILGEPDWATRHLDRGRLPGSRLLPLLRQVARKEYVRNDYSLNLSAWMAESKNKPALLGKVITHTTNQREPDIPVPFDTQLGDIETVVWGQYILAKDGSNLPREAVVQALHLVDKFMPDSPESTNLPTVFVILPFLAVGGAEQHALKVLDNLKEQFRFVVLAFEEMDRVLGTLADAFRQVTPFVYIIPDFMNDALNSSFVNYLIDRFQPGVFYIANGTPWIYDALVDLKLRYPGLRIINQVYDHQVGWINRYDPVLVLHIDAHIGVNSKICQAYIEHGAKPDHVYLIENGIVPGELDPANYPKQKTTMLKEKLGLPDGKKIITFASRIHPQKRPMDFVELARRFNADSSSFFLMVGDGPLAAEVDNQVAKIGLRNFSRHPFYRPISDIWAISDVVVLPSEFEGMPMVIIEAQAMGKPVVVTEVGNNLDVINLTQGGVVVPQIGDVSALVEGVRKMLVNPPDPDRVRQATLSHFDISIVAKKYRDAFLGVGNA